MHALASSTRSWPMLAALGAGLVLLALAAGAGGVTQPALAVLGIAALGWGVLALRAGRVLAPSVVLGVAAASLVGTGAAVTSGAAAMTDVPPAALAAASVFTVVVALAAGFTLRRRRQDPARRTRRDRSSRVRPDLGSLLGLVAGAALVAALATPALAATEAGEQAVPHGTHQPELPADGHGPEGHAH
jgi:hypothetical protein